MKKLAAILSLAICAALPAYAADVYKPGGGLKDGLFAGGGDNSWTGFYIGLNAGGGGANHDLAIPGSIEFNGVGGEGFFGGATLGYDKQLGVVVIGAFADYNFSNLSTDLNVSGQGSYSLKLDHQWDIGARAGFVLGQRTLIYGRAGYTEAHFAGSGFSFDHTFNGWLAGGGVEHMLGSNLSFKIEYDFSRYSTDTLYTNGHVSLTDKLDTQVVKAGIAWKFSPA